jgi:hypothetical protein
VPSLRVKADSQEVLLFQLIGIAKAERPCSEYGLIVGKNEGSDELPVDALYVMLPDVENPLAENDRLAELLGRAVGLGKVQL